jgi:hypothetical protein
MYHMGGSGKDMHISVISVKEFFLWWVNIF